MHFSLPRALLHFALIATVSAAAQLALFAQQTPTAHYPTTEDLRHLKSISAPQLSPGGKQALFTVTDSTADGAKMHLWVVSVASGTDKARQFTFSPPADKRGEHNGAWAPDGSAIFFLAKRDEHTQLFRLDLRGGDAAPYDLKILPPVDESKEKNAVPPPGSEKPADKSLDKKTDGADAVKKQDTDKKPDAAAGQLPIDVSAYALSGDGKWLAVWAHDPETPGEKKQKDAKADASWVDHEKHGTRLYLAALKPDGSVDGALKAVAIPPDVRGAVWSKAADRLLVFTQAPNNAADLGPAAAAYLVDATAPEKPAKLDAVPATVQGGAFDTGGDAIVFAAQTPEDAPPGYDELFGLSLGGTNARPIRLTAGFAGQVNAATLYFASDGSLITSAGVGTRSSVVRLNPDGKSPPAPIPMGSDLISGLNTNRAQSGWLWLGQSGGQPEKLCYAQRLGDACTALPTPDLAPADLRFVAPELVKWRSGGLTIEGLLYMPEVSGANKVPLIVDVHGGPAGAWTNRNDPFAAFMVGHGWAVLRPNPRGSSNYGVKFEAANKNDLGGGDYLDVMAGVDYVLAHYPLDPTRTALMGYSYGGEMAAFVEGKTDRFKAVISEAPVIDQFSEYGNEKDSWYDRWYYGKPWERHEDAWRQSPLAGASKAKTPFLLIQGQSDTTDPLGQSEEMYRALRQQGVPAELVSYPREDHGPLAMGIFGYPSSEPWHGYDARQHIVEFLDKAFGSGTPIPESGKP